MFDQNLRRLAVAAAAGIAMTLSAGFAAAQPAGAPHGPHAPHAGSPDGMLGAVIANAKTQLNLNSSQQVMFDAAAANTKAAHETGRGLHQKVKDALQAELAKPEPDLAAVAAVADGVADQGRALRQSVRSGWLKLYATFTPEQKGVVRGILQTQMAQAESFRQKMHDRMQQKAPGTSG